MVAVEITNSDSPTGLVAVAASESRPPSATLSVSVSNPITHGSTSAVVDPGGRASLTLSASGSAAPKGGAMRRSTSADVLSSDSTLPSATGSLSLHAESEPTTTRISSPLPTSTGTVRRRGCRAPSGSSASSAEIVNDSADRSAPPVVILTSDSVGSGPVASATDTAIPCRGATSSDPSGSPIARSSSSAGSATDVSRPDFAEEGSYGYPMLETSARPLAAFRCGIPACSVRSASSAALALRSCSMTVRRTCPIVHSASAPGSSSVCGSLTRFSSRASTSARSSEMRCVSFWSSRGRPARPGGNCRLTPYPWHYQVLCTHRRRIRRRERER